MVEDNAFTYRVSRSGLDSAGSAVHGLVTKERARKLDLLIHLLSNLTQALVICGPEGIGKTSLLNVLQDRKTDVWRYCFIHGNAALSFEAVQQQLVRAYTIRPEQTISAAMGRGDEPYQQIILIIDNAGELVPGLINAIIQYAAANPIFRVIFALTHDELQIKQETDRTIEDCHIIEVPPLSEKQCGDFLQQLSAKPGFNLSMKAISEPMIAHIYRETHGVPGRIIEAISVPQETKTGGKLKSMPIIALAAAIVIAVGAQWWLLSRPDDKQSEPVEVAKLAEQKSETPEQVSAKPQEQEKPSEAPVSQTATSNTEVEPKPLLEESTKPPVIQEQTAAVNIASETVNSLAETPKPAEATAVVKEPTVNKQAETKPAEMPETHKPAEEPVKESLAPVKAEQKPAVEPVKEKTPPVKTVNKPAAPVTAPVHKQAEAETSPLKVLIPSQAVISEKLEQPLQPLVADSRETTRIPDNLQTIELPPRPVDIAGVNEQQINKTTTIQPGTVLVPRAAQANNFTLQLMVLSHQSSIDNLFNKYPAMAPDFKVTKTLSRGQLKYVLSYGAYPDAESAGKAALSLPFEFRNALVRKIKP